MALALVFVGAGIIGLTNALCFLESGFTVTIFTKATPLHTGSLVSIQPSSTSF